MRRIPILLIAMALSGCTFARYNDGNKALMIGRFGLDTSIGSLSAGTSPTGDHIDIQSLNSAVDPGVIAVIKALAVPAVTATVSTALPVSAPVAATPTPAPPAPTSRPFP